MTYQAFNPDLPPAAPDPKPPPTQNILHDSRMGRNRSNPARGPKSFRVQKVGTGIRVTIVDMPYESIGGVLGVGSGTAQYLIFWAELVDQTSDEGLAAGFARATMLSPGIPRAPHNRLLRGANSESVGFYGDPKYQSGYFWCVGVDTDGQQSDPGQPIKVINGSGGAVPNDVEHFQAEEEGEVHGQTTVSAIFYSFRLPREGAEIDKIQFMFENYPNLNEFSEGQSVRATTVRGGTQQGKITIPVGRRIGSGTITIAGAAVTGVGTDFLSLAAATGGDQIEVFGVRARILSVSNNTNMTLMAAWGGPTVTAVADWQTIASVTVYAVSEGVNGARRDDPENAPSVTLDLDGSMSPPLAIGSLTLTALGNGIRVQFQQVLGIGILRYVILRSKGSTDDITTATLSKVIDHDPAEPAAGTFISPFDDTDFTIFDQENGQVFRYYVWTENIRGTRSVTYTTAFAACRLNSPADGGPQIPGQTYAKNVLWNGMCWFNADAAVDVANANQDTQMGGGVPPAGYGRWDHEESAGAPSAALFQNSTEISLTAPTAGKYCATKQLIGAWGNATLGKRRLAIGEYIGVQCLGRTSGGQPNGTFRIDIGQFNGAAFQGYAHLRARLSTDLFDESGTQGVVNGSDMTTAFQLYWFIFHLDATLTTTDVVVRFIHQDSSNGVNVDISRAMLWHGDALVKFTAELADPLVTYAPPTGGAPNPPNRFPDQDGTRFPHQPMEP